MPDSIDEPVDIRTFDENAYNQAVQDAKKAESLLIKQGVLKRKLAAGIPPIQTPTEPVEHDIIQTKTLPRGSNEKNTPANLASGISPIQKIIHEKTTVIKEPKKSLAAGIAPIQTLYIREPIEQKTEGKTLPKGTKRRDALSQNRLAAGIAPIQRKEKTLEDHITETIQKKYGLAERATSTTQMLGNIKDNPIKFFSDNLQEIFDLATPIAVAAIASQLVEEGISSYEALFKPGGPLDTRKIIHNVSKVIPQLKTLEDISSGTTFFTADAGQRLRQVAPSISNTRSLVQEHMRYIVQFQGT